MKRFVLSLLIVCFVIPCAFADVELSSMSFDELRELQFRVSAEIASRPEWKEVTVPAGDWTVGVDIPSGSYSLRPVDQTKYINVFVWGAVKNDHKTNGGLLVNDHVGKDKVSIGKLILNDGQIVSINYPVIFAPAESLGF